MCIRDRYKILDDKIIVYFYGELSSSNVSKYRNLINNILDKSSGVVYFDFLHTSFIDSSGIGLVLGRYNQLKNENRKLVPVSYTHLDVYKRQHMHQ